MWFGKRSKCQEAHETWSISMCVRKQAQHCRHTVQKFCELDVNRHLITCKHSLANVQWNIHVLFDMATPDRAQLWLYRYVIIAQIIDAKTPQALASTHTHQTHSYPLGRSSLKLLIKSHLKNALIGQFLITPYFENNTRRKKYKIIGIILLRFVLVCFLWHYLRLRY